MTPNHPDHAKLEADLAAAIRNANWLEAADIIEEMEGLGTATADHLLQKGKCLLEARRKQDARAALTRALALEPGNEAARVLLDQQFPGWDSAVAGRTPLRQTSMTIPPAPRPSAQPPAPPPPAAPPPVPRQTAPPPAAPPAAPAAPRPAPTFQAPPPASAAALPPAPAMPPPVPAPTAPPPVTPPPAAPRVAPVAQPTPIPPPAATPPPVQAPPAAPPPAAAPARVTAAAPSPVPRRAMPAVAGASVESKVNWDFVLEDLATERRRLAARAPQGSEEAEAAHP